MSAKKTSSAPALPPQPPQQANQQPMQAQNDPTHYAVPGPVFNRVKQVLSALQLIQPSAVLDALEKYSAPISSNDVAPADNSTVVEMKSGKSKTSTKRKRTKQAKKK